MRSNSFAHGVSNSQGNSACNGSASPASLTVTGVTLGGKRYGAYPELA